MDQEQRVFRKETMERISSPEQLTDYLKVATPGIWVLLASVLFLLGGLFVWASVGRLETREEVRVTVDEHTARVVSSWSEPLSEGMKLTVSGQDFVITRIEEDEYGRTLGLAEVQLPDGSYDGTVVTETTRPIEFLFSST